MESTKNNSTVQKEARQPSPKDWLPILSTVVRSEVPATFSNCSFIFIDNSFHDNRVDNSVHNRNRVDNSVRSRVDTTTPNLVNPPELDNRRAADPVEEPMAPDNRRVADPAEDPKAPIAPVHRVDSLLLSVRGGDGDKRLEAMEVTTDIIPIWSLQLARHTGQLDQLNESSIAALVDQFSTVQGRIEVDLSDRALTAEAAKLMGAFLGKYVRHTVRAANFAHVLDNVNSDNEARKIMTSICDGLSGAPKLCKVVLNDLALQKLADLLVPFLGNDKMRLHELSLANSGLSDDGLQVLEPSLEVQAPSLRKFGLTRCTWGLASFEVVGRLIGMMPNLEELDLSQLSCQDEEESGVGWNLIIAGLRSVVTDQMLSSDGVVKLFSIDLSSASLGNGSDNGHPVHGLAKVLAKVPNLKILRVNDAGLETGGFKKLATSLITGGVKKLSELGVEGLDLGPKGAEVVASFVMTQPLLQILNVSNNSMGNHGLAHFEKFFDKTRSLKHIKMDCNNLKVASVEFLEGHRIPTLEKLSIKDNSLGGVAGLCLLKTIYSFADADEDIEDVISSGEDASASESNEEEESEDDKEGLDAVVPILGGQFHDVHAQVSATDTTQAPAATGPAPVQEVDTTLLESVQHPATVDIAAPVATVPSILQEGDSHPESTQHPAPVDIAAEAKKLCTDLVNETMSVDKRLSLLKKLIQEMTTEEEFSHLATDLGGIDLKELVSEEKTLARKRMVLQGFLADNEASVGSAVRKSLPSILSEKVVADGRIPKNSHLYSAINREKAIDFLKPKLPKREKPPGPKPEVVQKLTSLYHF